MNTLIISNVKFNFIQLTGAVIGEIWISYNNEEEEYYDEIIIYMN